MSAVPGGEMAPSPARILVCFAAASIIALSVYGAAAEDLVVAAPSSPPTRPAPQAPRDEPQKPDAPRKGVTLGGSAYFFGGAVVEQPGGDSEAIGGMGRFSIDLYASIGLGEVSLLVGGSTLSLEVIGFDSHVEGSFPAVLTIGVRDDRWLVTASGGIAGGSDAEGNVTIPCPRGELRAGFRFDGITEITGIVGVERRVLADQDDVHRVYFGASVGLGGDG